MYKNILIPTDGATLSRSAIAAGAELAKALGAKVTAVCCAAGYAPDLQGPIGSGLFGAE